MTRSKLEVEKGVEKSGTGGMYKYTHVVTK